MLVSQSFVLIENTEKNIFFKIKLKKQFSREQKKKISGVLFIIHLFH